MKKILTRKTVRLKLLRKSIKRQYVYILNLLEEKRLSQ